MDRRTELTRFLDRIDGDGIDRNDRAFVEAIRQAKTLFTMSDAEIGTMFTVSRPTATRWANGVTAPHPAMRPGIYKKLCRKARQALRELGEHDSERAAPGARVV